MIYPATFKRLYLNYSVMNKTKLAVVVIIKNA